MQINTSAWTWLRIGECDTPALRGCQAARPVLSKNQHVYRETAGPGLVWRFPSWYELITFSNSSSCWPWALAGAIHMVMADHSRLDGMAVRFGRQRIAFPCSGCPFWSRSAVSMLRDVP